jgi:formylglycine-generating enzyme required for sulfatase activity
MTEKEKFMSAIVRIRQGDGTLSNYIGAGVLVSDKHIITCAHVITRALNLIDYCAEIPTEAVYLDFAYGSAEKVSAKVVLWRPIQEDRSTRAPDGEDIAILELDKSLDVSIVNISLSTVVESEIEGHSFEVYGVPSGQSQGVWIKDGVISRKLPNGWVQLENTGQQGYQLQPGFSGSPIWDSTWGKVAGIAVAYDPKRPEVKVAFMTPSSILLRALSNLKKSSDITDKSFEFNVIRLDSHGQIVDKYCEQANCFIENIGNKIFLEMVLIPEGRFQMGALPDEHGYRNTESPQHLVTVKSFSMSKYLITQGQWKIVSSLPRVVRDLNPNPSHFQGWNLPVEKVSWEDVEEFCQRLTNKLKRTFRLPSEAEWEYACRAGTNTPFYFGESITTDYANYNGEAYSSASKGLCRKTTTPVGTLGFANAFGLYDMHGNLNEWCEDSWHDFYENPSHQAPTDASSWNGRGVRDRVFRGGSWNDPSERCRSACRSCFALNVKTNCIGFRVVSSI